MRPLIVHLMCRPRHLPYFHRVLRGRRAFFVRSSPWAEGRAKNASRWSAHVSQARRGYPEHSIALLSNTQADYEMFQRNGLDAVFCSQNALLDEHQYRIQPEVAKVFDAVYNAQIAAFKRHELAAAVPRLSLLTYRLYHEPGRLDVVRRTLPHAQWPNFDAGRYRNLLASEVSRELNRARVGLMLSHAEGANFATVEYLLSGLPIVSTENIGGRDVFYEDEFTELVDATPEAVAAGVKRMIDRNPDPELIRERTLARMQRHRDRYIDLLQRICDAEGISRDMRAEWPDYFTNKMIRWRNFTEFPEALQAAEASGGN
jgi:glycosyltransferase involved in cell wall biosynthesis